MRRDAWLCMLVTGVILGCAEHAPSSPPPGQLAAGAPSVPAAAGASAAGSPALVPTTPPTAGAGNAGAAGPGQAGTDAAPGVAGTPAAAGGAGGSGTGVAGTAATRPPLVVRIEARDIPGGGEDHVCVVVDLGNDQPEWVTSVHATLTAGSHHLIVDRPPVGTALQPEPRRCPPTQGNDTTRLMIAQQRDTVVDMPQGTGLPIAARQPIFLQLHYINLEETTADVVGTVEVTLAEPDAPPPREVQSLFQGSTSLDIPAGEMALGEYFFEPARGSSRPWQVFALTSHTHSLGVRSTIERVPSETAPDSTPIHESLDWHEPPLTRFDPPLAFDGSDGLRLRCEYVNTTQQDVRFGTRFEDEMCFLWLYYYEE